MNVIYFLLPISLLLGGFFVVSFIWATKRGQMDDMETPAQRMLLDDELVYDQKAKVEGVKNKI